MVKVVATYLVCKNNAEEFLKNAAELVVETQKEIGCTEYTLNQDMNCEGEYAFIETWETPNCLQAHTETIHYSKIVPILEGLSSCVDVNVYESVIS